VASDSTTCSFSDTSGVTQPATLSPPLPNLIEHCHSQQTVGSNVVPHDCDNDLSQSPAVIQITQPACNQGAPSPWHIRKLLAKIATQPTKLPYVSSPAPPPAASPRATN